jgi:hypothetical protein
VILRLSTMQRPEEQISNRSGMSCYSILFIGFGCAEVYPLLGDFMITAPIPTITNPSKSTSGL